jgi:hypothetical protein
MLLFEICGLVSLERPLWREDGSAICSVITQWSESLRTRNHTLLSHLRLPQPGGPGSRIYIPQEQGGLVIPPGTGLNSGHCPSYLTRNILGFRYEPNRLMLSIGLWRWHNITVTVLDIIHLPVFLKVGCLHPVACTRSGSGFPSNATHVAGYWIKYSCISFKKWRFEGWILSPSSNETYSVRPNRQS